MRVLGEHALIEQPFGGPACRPGPLDELDAGPEPAATDLLDGCEVRAGERRKQVGAEPSRRLLELARPEHRHDATADRARNGVATERAPVLPRLEHAEDRLVRDHRRQRHDAAGKRLAEDEDIGANALVLARERRAGASEPRLDLVGDQQHVALRAEFARPAQVAVRRDDDAGLALDRLDEEGHGVVVERGLERLRVAVWHHLEPRGERPEVPARGLVGREADDRDRSAVEVPVGDDDLRAIRGHALDLVPPLASGLDRGLDGLRAGVHQQRHVHLAQLSEVAQERTHLVVVERAARERDAIQLLLGRRDQLGMSVTEVQRRVRRQHVQVPSAFDIGHPATLGFGDDDGQRVIVVRRRAFDELQMLP